MSVKKVSLYQIIVRTSFLRKISLFEMLSEEYLASIAEIIEQVSYVKEDVLCEQGDPGDYMYLIRDGQISIQIHGNEVAVLGSGDFLGAMSLIDGLPRSASVIVKSETANLMRISSDDFRSLLIFKPEISISLMQTISERLRQTN